ncbi:type II toxin-antitoxin system VapC family toxin [Spirosoma soli]|uniref:Type II toxin-antitoxin system VapC family toxin n=1 Tax=Spirosoma soli TaxID=1770529 RepID=A0ABW5M024_9BACT
MNIFLDTSSLFKLYHREGGTAEIEQLFAQNDINTVFLATLSKLEFRSIVWRRLRMKEITEQQGNTILQLFNQDYTRYTFIGFDEDLLIMARQLLDKYAPNRSLRSLDAIQLASAISIRDQVGLFKTADTLLHSLFVAEDLPVTLS